MIAQLSEVARKAAEAKKAASVLASAPAGDKNAALLKAAEYLTASVDEILAANKIDLENYMKKPGYTRALYDRLKLTEARIADMARGLKEIIASEDPIGEVVSMWKRPSGIEIGMVRVPLGVVGIIYEARPNVTVDAAALCIKAGNAVILRGGSEAINSNIALVKILQKACGDAGLPDGTVSLVENTDRSAALELMQMSGYLDVLIPRGGRSLIRSVVENSKVPVIQTGEGLCHTYVDAGADLDMALNIAFNAKTQRPGVCNAMETLLVHKDIAGGFLPEIDKALREAGVEVRGCPAAREIVPGMKPALEEDWQTEYLDLILSVKVVGSLDEAIEHIKKYGTKHSEAIVTSNYFHARKFMAEVDAAAVYVNASTRFTDGSEFGLGAEIGISTQKLHARGPMGLKALTSMKYLVFGEGQIR
ncbi:MAG TPA: glutamate-5-semialdehyde dehydrogenase [Firmicutes bacterium]|nr:glutamate-5-semialdehyde dehydrogenase [Bacillota bacterium]